MSLPSSINDSNFDSNFSTASVDDDASNLTSITLELYNAAQKTLCHTKSTRQINALIPLHVKEAMLEKEFPHIRGNGNIRSVAPWSINSTKEERSVDPRSMTVTPAEHSPEGPAVGERGRAVNYNDCVQTLSDAEMSHLRHAMHNHEKQRLMEQLEQLSRQMETFHGMLEENWALKEEVSRAERENVREVFDLEKRFIDMKLVLAQCQSREDHTRLKMARSEKELRNAQDENRRLQQKFDDSSGGNLFGRKTSGTLTQSLSSVESSKYNVRSGEPIEGRNHLLNRSRFGRESLHFFKRSNSHGESRANAPAAGTTFLNRFSLPPVRQKAPSPGRGEGFPGEPAVAGVNRSHSFVDPKRARALKGSEFMHWDSNSAVSGDEETTSKSVVKATLSRSLVHPKEAKVPHEPIGMGLRFQQNGSIEGIHAFGSQATLLSDITDIFGTKGETVVAERNRHAPPTDKEPLPSRYRGGAMPSIASGGSDDNALVFKPAQPQLQRALSLRGAIPHDRAPWQGTHPQKAKVQRQVQGDARPHQRNHRKM